MINRFLLGTVAIGALTTSALAADLPSRRAPPVFVPPPIPVFSWTGFYMGGDVGYAFGKDTSVFYPGLRAPTLGPFQVGSPNGIIGGAHVGYNFSTQSLGAPLLGPLGGAGGLIIGVEGDIDGTDWRSSQAFPGSVARLDYSTSIRKEIEGSARGRIGFAVDRALFFATGGAAFTQFQTTSVFNPGPYNNYTHSRVGWTVGGGAEYAITTQWSLRAEYRYSDFGRFSDRNDNGTFSPAAVATHHVTQQRATVGFSYKFDTVAAAPVVARY